MGYYDDRKHPVRTSKGRPKLDPPVTVREFIETLGKPAEQRRRERRRLQRLHALDLDEGKGGWLTQIGGKGPFYIHVSEYARAHPEEISGGQEETLEERVRRLERQVTEIRPLRERAHSLDVQVTELRKTVDALLGAMKILDDRMQEIAPGASAAKKKK